jgi:RNA polymerase sigma-70 factor (ECF subfamily)
MGAVAYKTDGSLPVPASSGLREEASLIHQILGGRPDLLNDLIQPHLHPLWRTVRGRMGNDPDVDDVVQQSVFKACTHLEQFRLEASFRTWLIRIALNEVTQLWRKRVTARSVLLDVTAFNAMQVADSKESPLSACIRSQKSQLIQLAIASLPEMYQAVIRMRDLEGHSTAEVAEKLSLSVTAVKTRHHRGRRRMAKYLLHARMTAGASLGRLADH